jgi:hypothetical protein
MPIGHRRPQQRRDDERPNAAHLSYARAPGHFDAAGDSPASDG